MTPVAPASPTRGGGAEVPDLQRQYYPDLDTASLAVDPAEAIRRARDTAEDLGWTQILDDPEDQAP